MEYFLMDMKLERRQLADKRRQPTTLISTLRCRGRRQVCRRVGEGYHAYVDWLSPRISGLALCILISSILDAVLTLLHVQRGGQEANPIMALTLYHSETAFIGIKMATTGFGVWLLAAHQGFLLAWEALHGLAGAYLLLLMYHGLLIWHSLV
jgi:hypothetical protein